MSGRRRVKLDVVECDGAGFFDPIRLCMPLRDQIAQSKSANTRSAEESEKAKDKALSKRVQRGRDKVVPEFVASHPGCDPKLLVRKSSAKHPKCLHVALLRAFVVEMFPGDVAYVADEDVRWLTSRAPPIAKMDEDVATDGSSGDDVDRIPVVGVHNARGTNAPDVDGDWWTSVGSTSSLPWVTGAEPWAPGSEPRLASFALPFGITLVIDPATSMVRVSDIATAFGKQCRRWLALGKDDTSGTRGVATALAAKLDVPRSSLAYVVANNSTWVHVRLVVNLSSWCNPAFAVHADEIVLRFYSGVLTTAESESARASVNLTSGPVGDRTTAEEAREASSVRGSVRETRALAKHSAVRAKIREASERVDGVEDFAIPRHLVNSTGCYVGAWGVAPLPDGSVAWHFKVGKAVEQPVTIRVRDHYNERPHTFVLLYVVGCDPSCCHLVESTMLHVAHKVLALEPVGGSKEEFFVPVDALDDVKRAIVDGVERRHADVVTLATDVPRDVNVELEKYRIDAEAKVKAQAQAQSQKFDLLRSLVNSGDERIRERALDAILRA